MRDGLTRRGIAAAACATFLFLFGLFPTEATAQSGQADLPSIGTARGTIYLSNPTRDVVIFYLESRNTKRTEHTLGAGQAATFSGAAGDEWFNIEVYSDGGKVAYGLDAGTRHYFEWRGSTLDLYKLPPR